MLKNYDVCVIFGGASCENEVSVITGTAVCNVLKNGGLSVLPVYITVNGDMLTGEGLCDIKVYRNGQKLPAQRCVMAKGGIICYKGEKPKRFLGVDCILNCCHGGVAEGGAISACAQLYNIPCASPSLFESAAFMDKYYTKIVLRSLRVATAKYAYSRDITGAIKKARGIGYPLIVKAATLGSSIGVFKVEDEKELLSALEVVFELDCAVIMEEYFARRRELNCAVYFCDGEVVASCCEEVSSSSEVMTYDDKYCGGGSRVYPVLGESERVVCDIAKRVYSSLNMRGVVRFDFILANDKIYLSEINTVPGSLAQYLVAEDAEGFLQLLKGLITQAKSDFKEQCGKRIISTGILNNLASNACKLK